jgi:cytochrome P450
VSTPVPHTGNIFSMAGSETTSQSISFAIWELARNPRVQDRLREEVQKFPAQPTYEQVMAKMPYLDAVTRESYVASLPA